MPTPRKKPADASPRPRRSRDHEVKAQAARRPPARKTVPPHPRPMAMPRRAAAGTFDLVIVESPAKAKTINKYLGLELPGAGQLRPRPRPRHAQEEGRGGRRHRHRRRLEAPLRRGRRQQGRGRRAGKRPLREDILAEIRREAAQGQPRLLASDPDREGESIAWHIADELKLDPRTAPSASASTRSPRPRCSRRSTQPEKINMDRVAAQEARRAMDRVVGFPLSQPARQEGRRAALSAGRVQSVAVKLIVDREREIEAFKTEEYWKITALLAPPGAGVAWTADPAKSKIFAKKKGETRQARSSGTSRPTRTRSRDPDEPVVDTETERRAGRGRRRAPAAPVEKGGIPTPPEKAFLAELAKWDGAEPKLGERGRTPTRSSRRSQGVPFVVTKVEQKDRQDRPQPAVHDQHAAAAGEHPAALQHQPHDADRPEALRGRRARRAWARRRSSPTCEPTARASRTTRSRAVRDYIQDDDAPRAAVPARDAERLHLRQERPGSPRGDPPDRRDDHAAAGAKDAGLARRPVPALHADLAALRRQPVAPAVLAVTTVEVTAGRGLFRASGRIVKFDGYRKVLAPVGKQEDVDAAAAEGRRRARPARPVRDAALHPAAAALQRGVAGQGAGEGRHRPAEHLREHHRHDPEPRLRRRRSAAGSSPPRSARSSPTCWSSTSRRSWT